MDRYELVTSNKYEVIAELGLNDWNPKKVIVKAETIKKAKILARQYLKNKYNVKKIFIIKIQKIKEGI